MTIYCPNYRCHLPQQPAKLCSSCNTPLDINGNINGQDTTYQLTKILQDSDGKIKDDGEYCWYELFQAQGNGASCVIKMLIIVPDRLSPSSDKHINKVEARFQREYDLLCKGLEGVCKGYEILDIPVGAEMVRAIVMEEISGLNLEEYVKLNRPIDSQRAIRWMKQLVVIIGNMHKNQVQHRDIKPTNIMVSGQSPCERLILIDFGIALDRGRPTSDITTTNVSGTPPYLDPLYVSTGKYFNYSDFYSLGKTFVYLLTGNLSEDSWYGNHNIAHPPINPRLEGVIKKMISPDVNKRFKTTQQILLYLESRYLQRWLKLLFLIILGLVISLLVYLATRPPVVQQPLVYIHPICEAKGIDCGDKGVVGNNEAFKKISSNVKKIQNEGFLLYQKIWKETLEERRGEQLIYLNNAEVQVEYPEAEKFTLLVAVPPYDKPKHVSEHILRGISQAQKEFNESSKAKLYIAILKEPDSNIEKHEDFTKIISGALDKRKEENFRNKFIGAIGHYSSQVTFDVLKTYADKKVLLISPSAASIDVPKNETIFHSNVSEYFARVVTSRRGYEVLSLLKQLAHEKNCDLLDVYLIYQKNDVYANSIGSELNDLLKLTETSVIQNAFVHNIPYNLDSEGVPKAQEKILSDLRSALKEDSNSSIKNCKPKQIVVFFPGPYTTGDQTNIITSVAKEIPKEANYIGNMTLDILSSSGVQDKLNDTDLYSRTFIISPFDIRDFLPSYFPNQKKKYTKGTNLIKNMVKDTNNDDIADVDWRQIASADSVRTFIAAIKKYQEKDYKSKEEEPNAIIRDIIRGNDFSAHGVFGKIEFSGYERKHLKSVTLLKYIAHQKTGKMTTVPIGYRDPQNPEQESKTYRPIHLDEMKLPTRR